MKIKWIPSDKFEPFYRRFCTTEHTKSFIAQRGGFQLPDIDLNFAAGYAAGLRLFHPTEPSACVVSQQNLIAVRRCWWQEIITVAGIQFWVNLICIQVWNISKFVRNSLEGGHSDTHYESTTAKLCKSYLSQNRYSNRRYLKKDASESSIE